MDRLRRRGSGALGKPRALASLGGGKGSGSGAEGVGSSHREEGNCQHGKGFGAKTITNWTARKAAEEGEGDQDGGSKPGRSRDTDGRRMRSERHTIREREEREERSANGPRRRPGKQQIDQHRRARLPHQRARDARDGPGGEIKAGAHRKRCPVLALAGLTRPKAIDGIATSDFTVVVRMGKQREEDRFYIVPTIVAWGEISKRQTEHKQRGRKDMGMWRLSFKERKDGREAARTGIEKKMGTA